MKEVLAVAVGLIAALVVPAAHADFGSLVNSYDRGGVTTCVYRSGGAVYTTSAPSPYVCPSTASF